MITLHLTGQSEKIAPENPWGLDPPPLYHQWKTAVSLQNPDTHLVVNSYNTGTGKTRAAFMRLFAINTQKKDVLFVAPTNALLSQHADDAREFVQQHNLDFKVIAITASVMRQYRDQIIDQGDYDDLRKGETLFRLIRNYREFYPDDYRRQGLIFVLNPDIFYYALMFQYGGHDQRNLFQTFLTKFNYIIIDEFHYYDQKQLAFFLFFFSISKKMGYFDRAGRKICLLSATPNQHVINYLNQLFGDNWQHIDPHNEPSESAEYATKPTLTPITLTLSDDNLLDWGQLHADDVRQWIQKEGNDGAVVSNSLRRVNQLYAIWRARHISTEQMRRITGPEPEDARIRATKCPLILATPTVDIGYNFKKEAKERQNIDFLLCEARFGDDLIQRIGRAGRVLGKSQTGIPSQAIALVKDAAVSALRPYDGQTLTRAQFKTIIQENDDTLPQKHNLTGYIRSWAITELFYPIYQAHRQLVMENERLLIEDLYEELCNLLGVRGGNFKSLSYYFRKYYYRQRWLEESKEHISYNRATAEHVADWFKFLQEPDIGEPAAADIEPYLAHESVLGNPERKQALRQFITEQVRLTKSLFNFRDSFQPPTAVCYDPNHLLSSQDINSYNILHIIESYDVQWFDNRAEFVRLCGDTPLEGAFYGRLRRHRDPLLTIELRYQTDEAQKDFQRQWEGQPVALSGFELIARERGGDRVSIDPRLADAMREQFQTALFISEDMLGWAIAALKHSPFYSYKLTIDFYDRQGVPYSVYLGKAAWLAYPELQVAYKIRNRMKSEAIII